MAVNNSGRIKSIENLNESDNKALILNGVNDLKVGLWPLDKKIGPKGEKHLNSQNN